jgi:F-type H+-transporting ATPase subunit delta
MAEIATIARPYAEAVFRLAKQTNSFENWSGMLKFAVAVVKDKAMQSYLRNPKLTSDQIGGLVVSVCGERLSTAARNFIKVLAENDRLTALPEIGDMFEKRRAEEEGVIDAKICSAFPLTDAQLHDLVGAVETRFKRKINPIVSTDPELIGGVRVIIGDEVIEASVRGKLQAMAFALKR